MVRMRSVVSDGRARILKGRVTTVAAGSFALGVGWLEVAHNWLAGWWKDSGGGRCRGQKPKPTTSLRGYTKTLGPAG